MNSDGSRKNSIWDRIKQSDLIVLVIALFMLCAIAYCIKPVFLSQRNIMNTLRQVSLTAICGYGVTMIVLVGEIDLSVGSQQAVAGIISIEVLNHTGSVLLAILVTILAGVLIGALNGILVTGLGINSMIVTLGTMAIWRGFSMVVTNAVSIQSAVPEFANVATGFIGPIPNAVVIAVILLILIYYILNHTSIGRTIYAVGGNKEAARYAGLPVKRIKMLVYILGGMLSMLSGVLLASRMASAQPTAGTGFEMTVIASVILGGVSLSGGIGSITGAVIGMLILGVLQNALTLMDVSSFWQDITRGIVIILAVGLDEVRKQANLRRMILSQKELQKERAQ